MKLPLPRRRIWRVAIYLVSFVLVLLAIDVVLVQVRRTIHPGFDTTRITGPLQADGSIDYLTAVENYFGEGVTPENNAAPLVLQALGRKALASNQPTDGITNRLGMPHLPEQGDYFIPYEDYCKQHVPGQREDDPTDLEGPTNWPSQDHPSTSPSASMVWPVLVNPQTQQWIKDNEKPLALLAEASKRSRFFIPFNGGFRNETMVEILIPHVGMLRDTRRALLTRAMLRLQAGEYDGFHDDVMTVHRLARLLASAPTMIERIVGARAMEIPACRVDRLAAASGKLSAQQARAFAQELAAKQDLQSMADSVNFGERFMVLDVIQAMARRGPTWAGRFLNAAIASGPVARIDPAQAFQLIPIPYEESMKSMNHFYDSAMAALQLSSYPHRVAMLKLWEDEVKQTTRHGPTAILLTPQWAAAIMLPAMLQALEKGETVRMERKLAQVALALAAFKSEHNGAYPAALAELSPGYLPVVPNDLFTEGPLVYARNPIGYTLYSVGPNRADDHGKSGKPADDIVANVP